jgi:hypothetical protein
MMDQYGGLNGAGGLNPMQLAALLRQQQRHSMDPMDIEYDDGNVITHCSSASISKRAVK